MDLKQSKTPKKTKIVFEFWFSDPEWDKLRFQWENRQLKENVGMVSRVH